MKKLLGFLKEEEGAHAVEYGLVATVIAVGILASLQGVRGWLIARFNAVAAIVP